MHELHCVCYTQPHVPRKLWFARVSVFVAAWERQHRKTNQSVTQHHVPEEMSLQTPVYFRVTLGL